jgi:hypothetical protein
MNLLKKINLSHLDKALLISIFIEILIGITLFNIGLKSKVSEPAYAVEYLDEDFSFEDLKPEEEIELPDITKYVNGKSSTNVASNQTQEDEFFEKYKAEQENALKEFYENRDNNQTASIGFEKSKTIAKKEEQKKRFTGKSNINYFIKNRRDVYVSNPLYTCPKYMSGLVVIDIQVDRSGKIVSAKFNKKKSTTQAACLIDSTIQAAYETYFNSDSTAPELQKGFITYRY